MSMYKNMNDVMKVFREDENLLRLLYYPPEDYSKGTLDPLDESLEDILSKNIVELWEIRDEHIMNVPKAVDLEEKQLCRIYVYAGRRNPTKNYLTADQELIIDILCHNEFERDLRSMRISDRLNELLIHERITGLGKIDYTTGRPISSPSDYVGYQHIYEFGSFKK